MKIIDCGAITESSYYYQPDKVNIVGSTPNVIDNILGPSIQTLNKGGVIVYPTDTSYALGVNALDIEAVEKLPKLKARPVDMPISVAVADFAAVDELTVSNPLVRKIYKRFLPGALTLILEIKPDIEQKLSPIIVPESNKIGIRIPDHTIALALLKRFGKPLTVTSANIHNKTIPVEISTSIEQFGDGVDLYLDCGKCQHQGESTILDVSEGNITIIREGIITRSELISQLEVSIDR